MSQVGPIRKNVLEIMGLSFVPIKDITSIFDELLDDLDEAVMEFATYIETFYIRGRPALGRRRAVPPMFHPELWNVYQLVLDGRRGISNYVEGFHSKLGKVTAAHRSSI